MKYILVFVLVIVVGVGGFYFFMLSQRTTVLPATSSSSPKNYPQVSSIGQNMDTPWAIAILPDGSMLITERKGTVRRIDAKGNVQSTLIATIPSVKEIGEGGLLGIALHPDFEKNNYLYLYYTYDHNGANTRNRVVRMTYKNETLSNEKIILNNIPGASNHNGGRIQFGPDKHLYVATGDAQEPSLAQDTNSLAGKILRVTEEGKPAPGNPFKNAIYSYGHRNVQGFAWDSKKQLWATEHGRSGAQSGLDELNLIKPGVNYGWPEIQGDETRSGMQAAKQNSGNTTWAPAGAAVIGNSVFFVGLRGQTLYEAVIENGSVTGLKEHFSGQFGRLRDVVAGSDGMLYVTTSNLDGRGVPTTGDDKVLRINPQKL